MYAYYYYPIGLAAIFIGIGLFFYSRRKGNPLPLAASSAYDKSNCLSSYLR